MYLTHVYITHHALHSIMQLVISSVHVLPHFMSLTCPTTHYLQMPRLIIKTQDHITRWLNGQSPYPIEETILEYAAHSDDDDEEPDILMYDLECMNIDEDVSSTRTESHFGDDELSSSTSSMPSLEEINVNDFPSTDEYDGEDEMKADKPLFQSYYLNWDQESDDSGPWVDKQAYISMLKPLKPSPFF